MNLLCRRRCYDLWIAFSAALLGCGSGTTTSSPVTILVSADTQGFIIPCGCASNQSGGLPRRGSWIVEQRKKLANAIYVDVGGAATSDTKYERINFEAILRGEVELQIAAHNIGAPEANLGPAYLQRQQQALGVPFVSCNVRDRSGQLLFPPVRIVSAGARRIAFVGVLSDQFQPAELDVESPREAILRTLAKSQGKYDVLVVLAYLKERELYQLAKELPEADLVVGGPTGQSVSPQQLGPTLVASATNKGKFVAEFTSDHSSSRWVGRIVELKDTFTDDPGQLGNVQKYYDRLGKEDLSTTETPFQPALPTAQMLRGFGIAGIQACQQCHADDCVVWKGSPHAKAWAELERTGAHVDANCQRCHTTGFGVPGGFVSAKRSPHARHVGCESCHGPSREHASDPKRSTALAGQAMSRCTTCHDRENSPNFRFDAYWAKIAHGSSEETSGEAK